MDPCAGMFSVEKACKMFPKHQRFVGCVIDAKCGNASLQSVVESFAMQVLNEDLDIEGSMKMVFAAWTYVSAMNII